MGISIYSTTNTNRPVQPLPYMTDLYKSKAFTWTLLLIFTIAWFYMLDLRTLVPTDEGRYAEMAREMVASGDWITTRLNGIKYFEKPPLQTWMNALTFELFGMGEWQARFWTGLSGFLGIVLTAYAGCRVFNQRVGFYAGLVLASSFLWAALGHVNTLDMGLSGMMTLALCALLVAQRDSATANERRNWMLACWAGMALAVMSKGLIGLVLPGAVLVIYTAVARDWSIWKRLHLGKGLLLFFAITTPWFVLVSLKNPEFPRFFFIHEHFERFLTKTHHREGPLYYFVPLLVVGILPWLGVFAQSVVRGLKQDAAARFQPNKMLVIWAGFIFFFFSISNSKLPSYILPIFPALALLLAAYLEHAPRRSWIIAASLFTILGAAGIVLAPKVATLTKVAEEMPLYQSYVPWVLAGAAIALVGGLLTLWCLRSQQTRRDLALVILAVSGFASSQVLMLGHEPLGRYASGQPLVAPILAELGPDTPLYAVGRYDQAIPYYLRRTMILVEHTDELAFGLQQQPELWIPTRAAFIEKWRNGPKSIAVTTPDIYADLQKQGVPMRVLAQDRRRIVIANDPKP